MVKARGGTDSIPSFLMDSIFLSDMHMATMSHRRPSYHLLANHQYALRTTLPEGCNSFGLSPYRSQSLALSEGLRALMELSLLFCMDGECPEIVGYSG